MVKYPNAFARPQLELSLASSEINNFKADLGRFEKTCKYELFCVDDEQSGLTSHRIRIIDPLPMIIARNFGQIASNLKHALDQAVHASFQMTNGAISKGIQFPTGRLEDDFHRDIKKRCANPGVHSDIIKVIEGANAFESGNPVLYTMNLFARHKHRNMVGLAPSLANVAYGGKMQMVMYAKIGVQRIADCENEFEIASVSIGSDYEIIFRGAAISAYVTERCTLPDKSPAVMLQKFYDEAVTIVTNIEQETLRVVGS